MYMAHAEQRQLDDRPQPVIAVDDDLLRHVAAGDYVATIEPTRRLSQQALDVLYEATLSACQREVSIGVTLKLFQHVRANLEYYVAYFAAKSRVTYFCTDRVEDAIKIRLCLERLGRRQKVLLLYAWAPELANLYVTCCALGMGPRWNLGSHQEEVLRIAIPIRAARIAHIKEVPAGWNLGYWENKHEARKRIGVLEATRLSSLKYEAFQRRPGAEEAETLRSMLSHGSIAALDLSHGEWKVGDMLACRTTMWMCFLSRGFDRKEDGSCLVAVKDAVSGKTTHVRVVTQELPNEHLLHNIEQSVGMLLNHHLECVTRKKGWHGS
jgi:hypothetical protein